MRKHRKCAVMLTAAAVIAFVTPHHTVNAQEAVTPAERSSVPRAVLVIDGGENAGPRIRSLATTIRSTLEFSLSLSGAIELVEQREDAEFLFAIEIVDNDDRIELNAERVSLIENTRTDLSQRTAESIFDVFAVADELALDIVRIVSNTDVAFGSILLENRGFSGTYRVLIDGVAVGSDLTRVDRVLTGKRTVTITGGGDESTAPYAVEAVTVTEEAPVRFSFRLPAFQPDIADRFARWYRSERARRIGEPAVPASPTLDEILADLAADRPAWAQQIGSTFPDLQTRSGRRARLPEDLAVRLEDAGASDPPRHSVYHDPPEAPPAHRILPTISPVSGDDLPGWRYGIIGNRDTPPIAVDPAGDSTSDGTGTDFHEVYALQSDLGVHVIVTFHDGEPSFLNGDYRIGFATEHVSSGLIEVMWRNEGGRPRAFVARVNPQNWIVLESFPAPTHYVDLDGVLVFTLPTAAIELARSRAKGLGWEFDAVLEASENGEYEEDDAIRIRERRIFF